MKPTLISNLEDIFSYLVVAWAQSYQQKIQTSKNDSSNPLDQILIFVLCDRYDPPFSLHLPLFDHLYLMQ